MGEGVHELERLTARQLQQLIEGGISTAVVPFGSVEHHGGHLPLGADAILADAVGAEVARRLGAVLAPTVRVGCSDRHRHLPGTLTLGPETLTRLAIEHARALARHGFTLIVLLSAHGGNQPALGIGYGLPRPDLLPWLPDERICFWGGWGGSMIIMDTGRRMTISYMMNKMAPGIIGSDRSATYGQAIYHAVSRTRQYQ
jgi:CubicO group peptidase (beta-lactamase class C family)